MSALTDDSTSIWILEVTGGEEELDENRRDGRRVISRSVIGAIHRAVDEDHSSMAVDFLVELVLAAGDFKGFQIDVQSSVSADILLSTCSSACRPPSGACRPRDDGFYARLV